MPLIDADSEDILPTGGGLKFDQPVSSSSPSALDVASSLSRDLTLAGAAYSRYANRDSGDPTEDPNFEPLDHIQGYEDHANDLALARSPAHLNGMKARIDQQRADSDVLDRAGVGFKTKAIVGLLDPSFLASVAVPELALAKSARLGGLITEAVRGGVQASVYEAGMHAVDDSRTAGDSIFNVGSAMLLGGILGASLSSRTPRGELEKLRETFRAPVSETGAASAEPKTTLEQQSFAKGGDSMTKIISKIPMVRTDLDIVMSSDSLAAKRAMESLADIPGVLNKNMENLATEPSVYNLTQRHIAKVADYIRAEDSAWAEYKQRVPKDGQLTRNQFSEEIAHASRSDDVSAIPEVVKATKVLRQGFDDLWTDANKLGLGEASESQALTKQLKELDGKTDEASLKQKEEIQAQLKGMDQGALKGDKSYFRRMWDRNKIMANRSGFDTMLRQHFGDASDPEIAAAVSDVTSQLLHNDVGVSNWSTKVTVPEAGPLKGRTLDIPTKLAEPYLVNDPVRVLESYTRDLAPQVEMARRFNGDVEMTDDLQKVKDEFDFNREKIQQSDLPSAEKTKQLNDLDGKQKSLSEALIRVRDRVLNRAGRLPANTSDRGRALVMKLRGWRNWVAATRMGGVAITGGIMDVARIAATYGFLPTITKLTQLASSPAFRELSFAQARRAGAACEAALARRAYDAFGGSMTDGWTSKMLHGIYKYSGLSHTTDFTRVLAGTLFEDRLIRAANKVAEGGTLKKFDIGQLANLGFDTDRLKAVAAEVAKNGGDAGGVFVSGSHNWADRQLAGIYDSALLKEAHIVVMQPGAADRVWWMDSETGKLVGQLKTFSLSTPMRMTITPVQMFANGAALQGAQFVGYMMIGGYLTHVFRQAAAGRAPETDPVKAAQAAFSEAGLAGVLPDIMSPASHLVGSALKDSNPDAAQYFGGPVKYSDRNPISSFGGPSLGTALDTWDFLYNRAPQGKFTANDLHAGRRLIPGQNLWWLRRGINALEYETADALNLEGSKQRPLSEYLGGFESQPSN